MAENNLCIALNRVGKTVDTPEGKLDILWGITLNNPELNASQQFVIVLDQLSATDSAMAADLCVYDAAVRAHNTTADRFPCRFYSAILGIEKRTHYVSGASPVNE